MKFKKNPNAQENTQQAKQAKRGIKGAFGSAKKKVLDATNSVSPRDGAMFATGVVATVGIGVGVNAYKKHQANKSAVCAEETVQERRRIAL